MPSNSTDKLGLPGHPEDHTLDLANKDDLIIEGSQVTVFDVLHVGGTRKFKIREVISRGDMGNVYVALDINCNREVVLKQLPDSETIDRGALYRFITEAQITSNLEHPNIVPVHEVALTPDGQVFYTMKYVRGVTLTEIILQIRRGDQETIEKYPLVRLLTIFQKVCDAMAFAHAKNIIHRDLKTDNVMIGDFGEVLVMDWGLAQRTNDPDSETEELDEATLDADELELTVEVEDGNPSTTEVIDPMSMATRPIKMPSTQLAKFGSSLNSPSGSTLGTPGFMSPEQIMAKQVDCRSDIYSLGAVLYSILTLHASVRGKLSDLLEAVVRGDIKPPSEYNTPPSDLSAGSNFLPHCPSGRIPAALSGIAMRAMATKPTHRYGTVSELQADIEAYLTGMQWNVVVDDNFSEAFTLEHWEIHGGQHEVVAGELSLSGGDPQYLMLKKPLTGDIRIEFECHLESDYLTDVACFIAGVRSSNWREIPYSGYDFKFGGYSNSANVIERVSDKLWSEQATPLKRGERYLICAERIGAKLRLTVNGEEIASIVDPDPLSGVDRNAVGICGTMTDTRYSRIRILTTDTPTKGDIWDIAERHMQLGHYTTAMDLFQDFMNTQPDPAQLELARQRFAAAQQRKNLVQQIPHWEAQLRKAWAGKEFSIRMDNAGLALDIAHTGIDDLGPAVELPLTSLYCAGNNIRSLEPLRCMQLKSLNCSSNPITDLTPLMGMPITKLVCEGCPVESLEPLRGMPLTVLNCGGSRLDTGLEPLRGMGLTWLCCWHSGIDTLEPLRGMQLTVLYCDGNEIDSLAPLEGMKLSRLVCSYNKIVDLEPLRGMPLTTLQLRGNRIKDLSPIRNAPITMMICADNSIESLAPLKHMRLNVLSAAKNKFTEIDALIDSPPKNFQFECDSMSLDTLRALREAWKDRQGMEIIVRDIDTILALRENNRDRLMELASKYNGHSYLYIPIFLLWEEARDFCESFGGHLVTIMDWKENEFINSLRPDGNWFWLGLTRNERDHEWITGEPYAYSNFVDEVREHFPGPKIYECGHWTCELYDGVSNAFVIEWES